MKGFPPSGNNSRQTFRGQPMTFMVKSSIPRPVGQWSSIVAYVKTVSDVRVNMCAGCGKAFLYDKNNLSYRITRNDTLEKVKDIVDQIRLINSQTEPT